MRKYHIRQNRDYNPAVNLDTIWTLVNENKRKNIPAGKIPVIDVVKAGYFKVLGRGVLPKIPVCIRARSFSLNAVRKIEKIGGKAELINIKKKIIVPKKKPEAGADVAKK